jgi:ankyrin repeat protein
MGIFYSYEKQCENQKIYKNGNTVLMKLLSMNNAELKNLIFTLIDKYKDLCIPNYSNNEGNTALMIACNNKMHDIAIKLIQTFGLSCNPQQINNKGNTALMIACNNNMVKTVNILIDTFGYDCNPQQKNNKGNTALIMSCINIYNIYLKICNNINFQIDRHCDNYYNYFGDYRPLILHINYKDAYEYLYEKDIYTIENIDISIPLKLIDSFRKLCVPEAVNNDGSTALHFASCNEFLIKEFSIFGDLCKPEQINNCDKTALDYACLFGNDNCIINIIDNFGFSCIKNKNSMALNYACYANKKNGALKLIDVFNKDYFNKNKVFYDETTFNFAFDNEMENVCLKLIDNYGIHTYIFPDKKDNDGYFVNNEEWYVIDENFKHMKLHKYILSSIYCHMQKLSVILLEYLIKLYKIHQISIMLEHYLRLAKKQNNDNLIKKIESLNIFR